MFEQCICFIWNFVDLYTCSVVQLERYGNLVWSYCNMYITVSMGSTWKSTLACNVQAEEARPHGSFSKMVKQEPTGRYFINILRNFILGNLIMRVVWKVSDLDYNWCETLNKRLLGRNLNRSWCHLHTSFFSGRSPWLHGHQSQHTSVLPLSPWIHGLRSRKLHRSVAVTLAPVQVLTQWLLVPSFISVLG